MPEEFTVGDKFDCSGITIAIEKIEGNVITFSRSDTNKITSRYDYALREALVMYGH